jgi:hypothetical protein
MEQNSDIESLSKFSTDEIFKMFKVSPQSWVRQTLALYSSYPLAVSPRRQRNLTIT